MSAIKKTSKKQNKKKLLTIKGIVISAWLGLSITTRCENRANFKPNEEYFFVFDKNFNFAIKTKRPIQNISTDNLCIC